MAEDAKVSWSSVSAPDAMMRFAPDGYDIFLRTMGALSASDSMVALIRRTASAATGLKSLEIPALIGGADEDIETPSAAERDVLVAFVEQFSVDVASVDDAMRKAFVAEFGDHSQTLLYMAYVADMAPRVMAALDRLFVPPEQGWPAPMFHRAKSADVRNDLLRIIYSLRALDPVLSEMIRLRGASQHNCRLCKSVLSRPAILAGANETIFDSVNNYREVALPDRVKAALAMVDAMIWQPAHIPQDVVEDIQAHFTPPQAIEIVLDVMRNAVNKVAVALDRDSAHVTEGFEVYEYFEDGHMEFGLT